MFWLTGDELERAFEAIEHHGYSTLLPAPPEWEILKQSWPEIQRELSEIDLDVYSPVLPLRVYAPKTRATVRVVSLLHPVDLIIYTALTLIVLDDLEHARIPRRQKRVFSYRAESGATNRLYERAQSYSLFRDTLERKSRRPSIRYVAIADIADFYPRIYQHRLENVIESSARSGRCREVARVLVRKFISRLSDNNSYGIPVGPYASRPLAEAVLIDVDAYLLSESIDFIRWVDDFYIFTRTEQEAQEILIALAQRLYDNHGLTLSALKTKIVGVDSFHRRFDRDPGRQVDERVLRVEEFSSRFDPYSNDVVELDDEEKTELIELNIGDLISEALEDRDFVDYDTLSTLLRHPALFSMLSVESRKNLGEVLLRNVEHLYPIAGEVAGFFSSFGDLSWRDMKRAKTRLLASLRPRHGKWPPDYYVMWILSLFAQSECWREAPDFARIHRDHRSEVVRRAAALAIGMNGNRADAVELKGRFVAASPLEQLAILVATRHLGRDERSHWKKSLQLKGPLEKRI